MRVIARFHAAMRKKLANRIGVRSISSVVWQNLQRPRWAPNRRLAEGPEFPSGRILHFIYCCFKHVCGGKLGLDIRRDSRHARGYCLDAKLELRSCELLLFC